MRYWVASLVLLLGAAAAGCGGGGHGAALPPTVSVSAVVGAVTGAAGVTSTVTMHLNIPTTGSAASARRAQTIPAATQSISVAVNGGTAQAFNATGASITAAVAAPLGSDTFTVVAYDAQNGAGNILATGSATATISMNQANTVAIVLTPGGATASSITLTVSVPQPVPTGTSQAIAITLVVRDAANNVITGTYASPFTVTSSDTTHFPVTAGATIANSTTTAIVTYDGSCGPPATISIGGPVTGSTTIGTNRHVLTTLADSGVGSLRSYLTGATSGDIIVGNTSGTIALASSLPAFAGNYSVCGAPGINLVVDGASSYAMFQVTAGASFQNLTLQHAFSANSGAAINATGPLTVNAVTFANNSVTIGSAAITSNAATTINNSTFQSNRGTSGGAILASGGSLTISNSTFTGNSSSGNAGALEVSTLATLTIAGSTFGTNAAGSSGGAVLITGAGAAQITGSTFSTNSAAADGGALEYAGNSTSLVIGTSTFTGNTATAGGALVIVPLTGTTTIARSSFSANSATGGDGGAAFIDFGTTLITNATFFGNTASVNGGGLAAEGGATAELDFTTFSTNTASGGTGGNIYNAGTNNNLILWANIAQGGTSVTAIARRGPQAAIPSPAHDISGSFESYGANFVGDSHFGNGNAASELGGADDLGTSASTLAGALAGTPGSLSITTGDVAAGVLTPATTTCLAGIGPFPSVSVDQRGQPRPNGVANACSSGAYEPP